MTTNQTIDGVPRERLERIYTVLAHGGSAKGAALELRALLDAPAPRAEFKKIEMAHVMNALEDVRGGPVLTSNQCHDLARALNDRLLSPLQLLAMPAEYLAAAQPQGEPVAWLAQAVGKGGEVYRNKASTIEPTMRDIEITWGQGVIDRFTIVIKPLYADQPAPVAAAQIAGFNVVEDPSIPPGQIRMCNCNQGRLPCTCKPSAYDGFDNGVD